jgi:hypothetical protein
MSGACLYLLFVTLAVGFLLGCLSTEKDFRIGRFSEDDDEKF